MLTASALAAGPLCEDGLVPCFREHPSEARGLPAGPAHANGNPRPAGFVSAAMKQLLAASALVLALAACSSEPTSEPEGTASATVATESAAAGIAEPTATPQAAPSAGPRVLTLEGLGDLRIGQAVPAGSSWAQRGAQVPGGCSTVSSPDYPGVYAIVEKGKVRRVTVGKASDVKLVEGVGVGTPEADVAKWFAGFRSEPHKYQDAPAKYLTAPNAASGDVALRFEIDGDGKVGLMHVGTMPVLGYVEGCG